MMMEAVVGRRRGALFGRAARSARADGQDERLDMTALCGLVLVRRTIALPEPCTSSDRRRRCRRRDARAEWGRCMVAS